MKRRVTHQDIAKEVGLDKSSVSLALRNHPSIPQGTRDRIKAMADKLGYRPDPALHTLARQRWAGHETGSGATLGYLVDSRMENFQSHFRFIRAARQRAEERGYLLSEFDLAAYPNLEAASRVLHHRGIRGLLVPQFEQMSGPGIADLPAEHFTVIGLDLGWDDIPFHAVVPDTFEETRLVWREVVSRGFRRIGGVVMKHEPPAMDDFARLGASLAAQQEWIPVKERIPLLLSGTRDRAAFLKWFKLHQPEVVVGFIPRIFDWLREAGIEVPFAAFILLHSQYAHVTGCVSQGDSIGAAGVDALVASIGENEWGRPVQRRKLVLQPVWNEGTSLGPGPAGRR